MLDLLNYFNILSGLYILFSILIFGFFNYNLSHHINFFRNNLYFLSYLTVITILYPNSFFYEFPVFFIIINSITLFTSFDLLSLSIQSYIIYKISYLYSFIKIFVFSILPFFYYLHSNLQYIIFSIIFHFSSIIILYLLYKTYTNLINIYYFSLNNTTNSYNKIPFFFELKGKIFFNLLLYSFSYFFYLILTFLYFLEYFQFNEFFYNISLSILNINMFYLINTFKNFYLINTLILN